MLIVLRVKEKPPESSGGFLCIGMGIVKAQITGSVVLAFHWENPFLV
jgi:hypothetical protein